MKSVPVRIYPFPDYGDLFGFDEFMEMVRTGSITDDDGTAEWAVVTRGTTRIVVRPSEMWRYTKTPPFSHILWFNK